MKKWFVVLCCLFLALSSAWGATLLSESFDGMVKGSLPEGWTFNKTADYITTAPWIGEAKPALKLTTKTAELVSPTFAAGATSLSFFSGTATNGTGIGNTFVISGLVGEDWVELGTKTCTAAGAQTYTLDIANSAITQLKFAFSQGEGGGNSSLDDILVEGEETVEGITVTFDQTNWFVVVEGTFGVSVTATADNGVPPYSYVWNCDQTGEITDVAGGTLAIPATLTEGDYTLYVTVTDSDDGELGPQGGIFPIGLRVVKKYAVSVVNGIGANGTISVSPAEAAAGEEVTIACDPDPGYVLESLSAMWSGGDLEIVGGKFIMPAGEVTVSGTFAEYTGGDLVITFDETTSKAPAYADTSFTSDGITFTAVQCQGGSDGTSGAGLRLRHNSAEALAKFETAAALEKPIARVKFAYKAGGSSHTNRNWALETSTDGAAWDLIATVTTAEGWHTLDTADLESAIPANSKFFRIISANSGSTARLADFDNVEIWYGEASYHVELSGVENGARVAYDAGNPVVTLTAEAKDGGTAPFVYEWTVNGEPVDGYTGATYECSAIGEYEVSVTCTDANNVETEPVGVSFSIEQQYTVNLATGVTGGGILADPPKAFAGETVTVTATPDTEGEAVYALEEITVTYTDTALSFAASPAEFVMPAEDVYVGGSFRVVQDTAALPFEWHGPWKEKLGALDGVTGALGSDTSDKNYENQGNGIAVFGAKSHNFCVKFDGKPETVSYWIHGTANEDTVYTFKVQESADGTEWTDVATYTSVDEGIDGYAQVTNELAETSRYVKFFFTERTAGSVGIDGIVISGEGGGPEPGIVFIGETTATVGDTIRLAFSLENYDGNYTWALDPAEGYGAIDPSTGVYTWEPTAAARASITVSALDASDAEIASTEVLLTVEDAPGGESVEIPMETLAFSGDSFSFTVPDGYTVAKVEYATELENGNWKFESEATYAVAEGKATVTLPDVDNAIFRVTFEK
jgi:hypothetical protein